MDWLDPEFFQGVLTGALQSQVTQFGVAFALAAWIHSGRMKKEIGTQLSSVTAAINNLGTALRQDLAALSERIGQVESRMDKIEGANPIKPNTPGGENVIRNQ